MTDRSIPPGEGVCGTCGSDDPAKRQRDPDSYHPDGCLNPFHTPSSDTQEGEGEAKRFRPCARCGHPKNDHADTDQKFCLLWRGPKRCECERWVDPAPPKPSLQVDEGARVRCRPDEARDAYVDAIHNCLDRVDEAGKGTNE
jgi:hypothetical protein